MGLLLTEEFGGSLSGSLAVTDSASKIGSPVNGRRLINGGAGSPVWGNPGFRFGATPRANLGPVTALVRTTNHPGDGPALVIQESATLDATNGLRIVAYDVYGRMVPGGRRRRSIDYLLTAVPRVGGGVFMLLSGGAYGAFPAATLVDVSETGAGTDNYVFLAGHSGVWYADWLHIHDAADIPTPMAARFGAALAGDDFTGTNGANLNGRTALGTTAAVWALNAGTATIQSNSASLGTGGSASVNVGTRPRIVEATITRGAGATAMLLFRGGGSIANSWRCKAEFDRIRLEDNTGATLTQTGAISFTQDVAYRVRVIDTGARIECFVNGTSWLQHNSTTGNTNTQCGIASISGASIFDDFAAWPESYTLPATLETFPAPPTGQGAAIVAETFPGADGAALPGTWTADAGTWHQNSGRGRMTTAAASGAAAVSTGSAAANHEVKADILLPSTTPTYPTDWFPGVNARATDANNLIQARLLRQYLGSGDPSNEVEIWEYVANTGTIIGYINLADILAPGSSHNLRLAVLAAETAAYLDGELVVQATTSVLSGSRAGIGVKDNLPSGQPAWDNVEVRATGASSAGPVISNVQVVWRRSTTARITWTTDVPARGRVDHGATSSYGQSTTLSGLTTSHDHTLSGITPGSTWHFSVYSEVD